MKLKTYNLLPEFGTNTYLIWDESSNEAAIIDCAAPDEKFLDQLKQSSLLLKFVICTHGHGDHIGGNQMLKSEFSPAICIHQDDAGMLSDPKKNLSLYWEGNVISPPADRILHNDDEISLGKIKINIIHTPGHSRGSVCLITENLLFSGDTLFAAGIGRTDLPGGNYQELINSIQKKIFTLPESMMVYPGHGQTTTIGQEKIENPFAGLASKL